MALSPVASPRVLGRWAWARGHPVEGHDHAVLLALRPPGDWQRHVDPNTACFGRLHDRVTELVASCLPVLSPACEPFRSDLDNDVETADVVRPPRAKSNFDIAGLELFVVRLFGAFDGKRYCLRQRPRET